MPISSYVQLSSISAISTGATYLTVFSRNNSSSLNILGRKVAVGVMISGAVGWILYWSFKKFPLKSKKSLPKLTTIRKRRTSSKTTSSPKSRKSSTSDVSKSSEVGKVSKIESNDMAAKIDENKIEQVLQKPDDQKNEISISAAPPLSPAIVTNETQNPTDASSSSVSLQSLPSEASTQNATVSKIESNDMASKNVESKIKQVLQKPDDQKNEISISAAPPLSPALGTSETQNPTDVSSSSASLQISTSEASTQNATISTIVAPPLSPALGTSETQNPTDASSSSASLQTSTSEASTQNATVSKIESPLKVGENKIVQSPKLAENRKNEVTMDDKEKYSEETTQPNSLHPVTFPNKTIIFPLFYESYRPVNLTHPTEGQTQISSAAMQKPEIKEDATMLTPFRPILHSMYYAHRHALLIEDLIQNYQFLED
uniref:Uncharacterized protein n=1 Tax=Panagrolaimus sp. ES5 TaxID=591445 RepID=A0AC34FYG6_9BILA